MASRLENLEDVTSGIKKKIPLSQLHTHLSNSSQVLQARIGVGDQLSTTSCQILFALYRLSRLCFLPLSPSGRMFLWLFSVTKPCPTLCDPPDCSPPGSSVRGILQARIQQWVAMSSSGGGGEGLPNPRMEPVSPAMQRHSLPLSHQGRPRGDVYCENQ